MSATPISDASASILDPTEDRIRHIHTRKWFGYARARAIRDRLESLLAYPKTHRMPNLALIADSNNGKTMLLKNFCKRHGPPDDPNVDHTTLPVLMIQTPPEPDEGRLYRALLKRLFASVSHREPPDAMFSRLEVILRHLETRMLVLDEFNNAVAGNPTKQRRFLNAIRYVGNELKLPTVVAGTPEALAAIRSDPQLANRFEPVFLPKWKLNEELGSLLASAEKHFTLRHPSNLHEPKFAQRLLDISGGNLGEIMDILRRLAEHAVRSKEEKITIEMLKFDTLTSLGWTEPSKRMTVPV